jgi:DNA-binding MarR family transcriptional regulator
MTDPAADTTRLIDRLVRDGLAVRGGDTEDRRVVRVRLTDAGQALLARLDAPLLEVHRAQFGHMAADEIAQLIALLRRARGEEPRRR